MNNKKITIAFICVIVFCVLLFILIRLLHNQSLYSKIEETVLDIDAAAVEILHVHLDKDKILVFYSTSKNELGVVKLQEKGNGFQLKDYISKSLMYDDKGISWAGVEKNQEKVHLLLGAVQNAEITQVVIISEGSRSANIIKSGTHSIWYALLDEPLHDPITIRATDKEGKVLFESGDTEYWNKR